jgi:DNA-binding transcriptional regulator YdaS (Cro superfamily)
MQKARLYADHVNAIHIAISQIGSCAEVARMCAIKPQMVSQWRNGTRPVSPRCALVIEADPRVTVTRFDLCPSVFGEAPQKVA